MDNDIQRVASYLVYQPRIQASLDRSLSAWNLHKIRTARNRSPVALFELSREAAITRGYWTGDPGDNLNTASDPNYGVDGEAALGEKPSQSEDSEM
ncbi:hypothetical protein FRC02_004297 [Tulasnella sp. 418]|nr:hypothetical protein FRC02_004297 [Tulasnella sp. 418]